MNKKTTGTDSLLKTSTALAVLALFAGTASAQTPAQPSGAPSTSTTASDPNPYYLGISQALTHDSNVTRSPGGPSDNYSSTSLLGGFDQPIGRQRVFGNATVSANRFQDQDQLNNTSYGISGGLDWQTVADLSGNLNGGVGRFLAAPAASGVVPGTNRNIGDTKNANAVIRWGGASRFSVEGALGYSEIEYSAPEYVTSNSSTDSGSLGLYYRPGGNLRLGVAGRVTKTDTPQAVLITGTGFQSNSVRSKNLDLIIDYELTGLLSTNARISYTKQTNSGLTSADFSGVTGNISLQYRPTAKTTFNAFASRDVGFNSSLFNTFGIAFIGATPVLTTVSGLSQNNQITNTIGLNIGYAATAKVTANASLRYARARLVTTVVTQSASEAVPDTTDILKTAQLGATWAIARNWSANCSVAHEARDVSGNLSYAYSANTISCAGQYTWR
jgi:hypothetical protein